MINGNAHSSGQEHIVFYENVYRNCGWNVKGFFDTQPAIEWLES